MELKKSTGNIFEDLGFDAAEADPQRRQIASRSG